MLVGPALARFTVRSAEAAFDIVFKDIFELFRDVGTAQHQRLFAVDEDGCGGLLAGAGQ